MTPRSNSGEFDDNSFQLNPASSIAHRNIFRFKLRADCCGLSLAELEATARILNQVAAQSAQQFNMQHLLS